MKQTAIAKCCMMRVRQNRLGNGCGIWYEKNKEAKVQGDMYDLAIYRHAVSAKKKEMLKSLKKLRKYLLSDEGSKCGNSYHSVFPACV